MLSCIWDRRGTMTVVETEEYERLMATGDYFDNPWDVEKLNEVNENEKTRKPRRQRAGHNLQSEKLGDDGQETSSRSRISRIRRRDDEYGSESSRDSSSSDQGDRPRISSEITGNLNVAIAEDNQ